MEWIEEFQHQVGGHKKKHSLKRHRPNTVLKPFQSNGRGEREYEFYQSLSDPDLQRYVPKFMGTISQSTQQFIELEDITAPFVNPSIMDLKLGVRTYELNATAEKKAYEQQKFPLQEKLGFRLQGMKVYSDRMQAYDTYDKYFGRNLKEDEIVDALRTFFGGSADFRKRHSTGLIQQALHRLEEIKQWFERQTQYEFISSSILIVYSFDSPTSMIDVRLIDFAHVTLRSADQLQRDEGCLVGLKSLVSYFEVLIACDAVNNTKIIQPDAPDALTL